MTGPQHQHFRASIEVWKRWGASWIEELAKREPTQAEWVFLLSIITREGELDKQGHYSELEYGGHCRMPDGKGNEYWTHEVQPVQSTPGAKQYTPEWRLLVRNGFVYFQGNDWIR